MSLTDSKGMLATASKELQARWLEVRVVWSDKQSEEFEKKYLAPLLDDVRTALTAMDNMNTTMRKIESDCR